MSDDRGAATASPARAGKQEATMRETTNPKEARLETEIRRRHEQSVMRSAAALIQQKPRAAVELFDCLPPAAWADAICEVLSGSMDGECRARLVARLGDPEMDETLHYMALCAVSDDLIEGSAETA
jgi:hypothetical protein